MPEIYRLMNKINLGLNVVLLLAVAYLFFRSAPDTPQETDAADAEAIKTLAVDTLLQPDDGLPVAKGARIVFVNAETLNEEYQFIVDKYEELEKEQMRIEKQIERKMRAAEERYLELESQAPTMTQSQLEQAQIELQGLQQDIAQFQERAASDFRKKEARAQEQFFKNIREYLKDLNEDGRYDYILTYQVGGQLLLANEGLDITRDVVDGLNEAYSKKKASKE
ncbi:MAG: OmpH family outer membrane protein [Cryomorphaceae bacterium]|nr:MAG: OmpH family outer membrane protein [Cryomorphaceae bacterium]